jgi:putative membrane protein
MSRTTSRPSRRAWRGLWLAAGFVLGFASRTAGQTPIPPSAVDFANSASQADEYEIQAARDVLGQSQNPQVRAFAQMMIQDHMALRAATTQAASRSGLASPPVAMRRDQAAMLSALQALGGGAI